MDWDEDGDLDLLVGERDGYIVLYENIGSTTDPILTSLGRIQDGSNDLYYDLNATPCIVDWNLDGKKDILYRTC